MQSVILADVTPPYLNDMRRYFSVPYVMSFSPAMLYFQLQFLLCSCSVMQILGIHRTHFSYAHFSVSPSRLCISWGVAICISTFPANWATIVQRSVLTGIFSFKLIASIMCFGNVSIYTSKKGCPEGYALRYSSFHFRSCVCAVSQCI